jgi:hypothetical protein
MPLNFSSLNLVSEKGGWVVAQVGWRGGGRGINVLQRQSTEDESKLLITNRIPCYLVINICAQNKEAQSSCGITV